jgi:hypothetical protein
MKHLIMQFLRPPVTSSLFGPNILLSALFSNTLSLCSSFNVREQVSQLYKNHRQNFYVFGQQRRRQNVLNRVVGSITPIQYPVEEPRHTGLLPEI